MLHAARGILPDWRMVCNKGPKLHWSLLWLAIFLLPGSSLARESDEPAPMRDTVQHALVIFVRAFDALDWKTFRDCFSDSPNLVHPAGPNVKRVDSAEGFDEAWHGVFERIRKESGRTSPPYMQLQPSDLRIEALPDERC